MPYTCSVSDPLGAGQFGKVFRAEWNFSHQQLQVAIKILGPDTSEVNKVKFLQEAAIMGQFSHPNIVRLYGVVTVGEPVSAVQCAVFQTRMHDITNFHRKCKIG